MIETLVLSALSASDRLTTRDWEGGIRRAALALCGEAARSPGIARLVFVEILAPGLAGRRRREHLIAVTADRLRRGGPRERRPSGLAEEASVAAAWELIQAQLDTGGERSSRASRRRSPTCSPTPAVGLDFPAGA